MQATMTMTAREMKAIKKTAKNSSGLRCENTTDLWKWLNGFRKYGTAENMANQVHEAKPDTIDYVQRNLWWLG
ncbi:MAG: hypothetical protein IKH57_12220 [Clostridia bacterium]|nr:hypothetical protein [Clostridia bacterium]